MAYISNFLDRFQLQDVIAFMFASVVSFLWLTGGEVPEGLLNVTLIIVGFFFGDRNAARAQERAIEAIRPAPAPVSVGSTAPPSVGTPR